MPPETLYTLVHTALQRERFAIRAIVISIILFFMLPALLGNAVGPVVLIAPALAALASFYWLAHQGSRLARLYKKHEGFSSLATIPIRSGEHFGLLRITTADDDQLRARHIIHPTVLVIIRPLAILTGISLAVLAVLLVVRGHLPVTNYWWFAIGIAGVALAGVALVPATLTWSITQTPESLDLVVIVQRLSGRRVTYELGAERINAVLFDDGHCGIICDQESETEYSSLHLASISDGKRPWRSQRLASEIARRLAVPTQRAEPR